MSFLDVLIPIHVVAAVTALATLAVPLIAKKGGRVHRRVGFVYVWAMAVATSTGAVVSAWRLAVLHDPRTGRALFLGYASLLAGTAVFYGVRVLGAKNRTAPRRRLADLILPSLLVASGIGLITFGAKQGWVLLMAFPPIGVFLGAAQLGFWLRAPKGKLAWWFEHMGGMIASGIAALTAFLVTNAPRLHLPSFSLWIWLSPTAIGVPLLLVWRAYYARRFARAAA